MICFKRKLLYYTDLFRNPTFEASSPSQSLVTVVKTITTESIINNIGENIYEAGQTYSWIVQFKMFLTIIVTRLSLNEYQVCITKHG